MSTAPVHRTRTRTVGLVTAVVVAGSCAVAALPATAAPTLPAAPASAGSVVIDRAEYADRMAGMWMAECLGVWTGLITEHDRPNGPDKYSTLDPFYTDADWGTEVPNSKGVLNYITWSNPDPCGGDDDTDIEYSYLHQMVEKTGSVKMGPEDIADMWNTNVESFVWFSNSAADLLIESGTRPPSTTLSSSNQHRNIIDAQLTTELFGALAPARPDVALDIAQLPVRTSAGGFATHAAQFNVLLYSLAPLVDQDAAPADQIRWLIEEARRYLPADSRITEIIDWVVAEYDANPGEPWEALRDKIYDRYQKNSVANGFNFIIKYESAVNLAAQVAELLHGEGDLLRTIQIGTLFGWDADNPAATNAGLIGLMRGTEHVEAELTAAGIPVVERYNAFRTRVNITDYLPDDPEATDTFDMMGARALPLVDEAVLAAGGTVTDTTWTIPLVGGPASGSYEDVATVNPDVDLYVTSGNNQVLRAGGSIDVTSNLVGDTSLYTLDQTGWPAGRMMPTAATTADIAYAADGFDQDTRGREEWDRSPFFVGSTDGADPVVEVTYSQPVEAASVRVIGGGVDTANGGWATGATVEVRTTAGEWVDAPVAASTAFNKTQWFQQTDLVFEDVTTLTGVRVSFEGTDGVLTLTEIDPVSPSRLAFTGFDADASLAVTVTSDGVAATSPEAPAELTTGEDVTLSYTITNTGDAPLTDVVLRDEDGQPIVAGAARALAAGAELLPGQSTTVDVTLTVAEGAVSSTPTAFARGVEAAPVRAAGAWYGVGVTEEVVVVPTDEPTETTTTEPAGPGATTDPTTPVTTTPGGGLAQTGATASTVGILGALLLLAGGAALAIRRRLSSTR